MTDQTRTSAPAKGGRGERLKQALRENLKRRKAQSRERGQAAAPVENDGLDEAPTGGPDDVTR
ncbi:hypothetical protein LQG66_27915 [Bradyrhizobium ontarionense]|uniref:DUF4169 domain-containing protein n=1 Tax=Bradyrhizobium ontarionense TaxID=2898149 RepID=A0ABY3R802_9BRAD|nr:hypothetical protein [Bradyrhizobium sp. A19]UFZ03045.1 hypothetical protein LQG66_27915 [Bradyrhizobium sp. A19]